eukprot:2472987-Rhodomonas_salina.2
MEIRSKSVGRYGVDRVWSVGRQGWLTHADGERCSSRVAFACGTSDTLAQYRTSRRRALAQSWTP